MPDCPTASPVQVCIFWERHDFTKQFFTLFVPLLDVILARGLSLRSPLFRHQTGRQFFFHLKNNAHMPRKRKNLTEESVMTETVEAVSGQEPQEILPFVEDDLPEGPEPKTGPYTVPIVAPEHLSPGNKKRYENNEAYRKMVDKMLPSYRNFGKTWNDEERELLRKLYKENATDEELEMTFGRTIKSIYMELIKMREFKIS